MNQWLNSSANRHHENKFLKFLGEYRAGLRKNVYLCRIKSNGMKHDLLENAPLVKGVVCLMAGIVVGQYLALPPMLPVLGVMMVVALWLWRYENVQSVAVFGCLLVLGAFLMQHQKSVFRVDWPEGEVCYEAVVMSEPVEKPKTMAVDILLIGNHRKLKCYLYKDERSRGLRIGDGLRIQSRIRANSDWRRGAFDYRRYLEIHGFSGSAFVSASKWRKAEISLGSLSRLERTRLYFLKQRSQLLGRFARHGLDSEQYAVVAAMALGDKSALTQELKDVYAETGASHVLALSGLHLGIIYALLSMLIVGRRWRMISQILIVIAIWAFVFLVGMSVSVVRAAVMLTAYALLSLGDRRRMSLNTLAFAALVLLLMNPMSLFDVGFQMSFMAVGAIIVLVPWLEGLFPEGFLQDHRVLRWLWSLVAVACAAQIGVAPLIAYYFERIATYFLLTNLIVVPAATLILWLSIVVLLVPSLAFVLIYLVTWLNAALTAIAAIPGASISVHPTALQVVMVYVVIVAICLLIRIIAKAKGWSASRRAW